MFTIENEILAVSINTKGAELNSIFSKQTNLEYLWSGDGKYWNKKSPILFPIVGTLKDNTYYHGKNSYKLGRHGFARDREFSCTSQSDKSLTMTLTSDEESLQVYPFNFRLDVVYSINNNCLTVQYRVTNIGDGEMFFSIGAHPAFRLPIVKDLNYDDYYLEFGNNENALRWLISPQGLIEPSPVHFFKDDNKIALSKELFMNDAIVFKYLNSEMISIKSDKSKHSVSFRFSRFPFFGIWAAPNADFVCLEPWCGIADSTTHDQQLDNKEGINFLASGQTFERSWEVELS